MSRAGTFQLLKRTLKKGRPYIPAFLFLGGLGLLMVPVEIYGLQLFRKLIDKGLVLQNWGRTRDVLLILIVLIIIRSLVNYGTSLFSKKLQLKINQKFQNELFSHILWLPMRFFTNRSTGQLMSRVLDDAARISSIFSTTFGPGLVSPLQLLALLIFLGAINMRLCAVILVSALFSILVIDWLGKRLRIISKEIQSKNSNIYNYTEEILSNIELIKSKNTEKQTGSDLRRLLNELIQLSFRSLKTSLIPMPVFQLLTCLNLGAIVLYGGWMISKGLLTAGTLGIFLGATYLLFNALDSIGKNYGTLRENLARLEVIFSILDIPPESSGKGPKNKIPTCINSIEFKNIAFGYNPAIPVLKDISFKVLHGEVLGITGQSGSGKTTLARLLMRFYDPDLGEISLNERPIENFNLTDLRSCIGIVFQENLILNDSIKNNITYGNRKTSFENVLKAAKISHAHGFIDRLPSRYETRVGEGGKTLSGGQRQRIAIARAIIEEPEILILDEGTSFLEMEQEQDILQKIKKARRNKITIIITHRLSAIRMTERALTLDNGRIIETNI